MARSSRISTIRMPTVVIRATRRKSAEMVVWTSANSAEGPPMRMLGAFGPRSTAASASIARRARTVSKVRMS